MVAVSVDVMMEVDSWVLIDVCVQEDIVVVKAEGDEGSARRLRP